MAETVLIDIGGTHLRFIRSLNKKNFLALTSLRTNQPLPQQILRGLQRLNLTNVPVRIGMRGVWTNSERRTWERKFSSLAVRVKVESDVELAYRLSFGRKPGILLIAGTGSICLGKNSRGRLARAGGLGPIKGDEGSAYWLAKEFTVRSGTISHEDIQRRGKNLNQVRRLASKAPRILSLNNPLAHDVIREAAAHLLNLVLDVRQKLKTKSGFNVHLHGGMFENRSFRRTMATALRKLGFRVV